MNVRKLMVMTMLMAKHDHGKGGGGAPAPETPKDPFLEGITARGTESAGTAPTGTTTETAPPPPEVKVDTDTGEVSGIEHTAVKMLKKLVAKEIVGRAKLNYRKVFIKDAEGKETTAYETMPPRQLYVVFGQARDTRTGESDYGPWVAFLGTFEAVVLESGERFVSDKLHLQDPAEGLLLEQLSRREKASDAVQFTFEIGVKPSQKWMETDNGNSYEYTVTAHFKLDKADPLAEMRRMVLDKVVRKALPGPK